MASGAGAPALIWHVSFRSEDAIEIDDDKQVFTFYSGINRLKVFKTTLTSLEFPLSQRTIEAGIDTFYFSEGFIPTPGHRDLALSEIVPCANSTVSVTATLPVTAFVEVTAIAGVNVTLTTLSDDRTTPSPHGLFQGPNDTCVVDMWAAQSGEEKLRLVLPDYHIELECGDRLKYVSPTEFIVEISPPPAMPIGTLGFVYVPALRTPSSAAALVQWLIGLFPLLNNYRVTFDAPTMVTTIESSCDVQPTSRLAIPAPTSCSILGWLGFVCATECSAAGGAAESVGWLGEAQIPSSCFRCAATPCRCRPTLTCIDESPCVDYTACDAQRAQLALPQQNFQGFRGTPPAVGAGPAEPVLKRACNRYSQLACQSNMWVPAGVVKLKAAWYSPASRSNGPTEPICPEIDLKMARFRLAPPAPNQQLPPGVTTIHQFVTETPLGVTLATPIQMGHYTPESFAQTLEFNTQAAALAATPGVGWPQFRVVFDESLNQFQFADVDGRSFAICFDNPFAFSAERVGFVDRKYSGSAAYAGESMVLPKRTARGADDHSCCGGWPLNWYSCDDGGATRRVSISGNRPRTVYLTCHGCPVDCTGVPPSPPNPPDSMLLATSLLLQNSGGGTNVVPFALPYQPYDVVTLSDLTDGSQRYGLVLAEAGETDLDGTGNQIKLITLWVPGVTQAMIGCDYHWTLQQAGAYSPLSLAFPGAQSSCTQLHGMRPEQLGYPRGATLWTLDNDNILYATSLHNLEHPDYVLMDLGWNYLRKTDTFQVQGQSEGGNVPVFSKLVLYPQYQLPGLLPRDIITANMDSPEKFSVRFLNPDLSPYRLNGRNFSFTLQYTSPLGLM
jgi:hypothetical protein